LATAEELEEHLPTPISDIALVRPNTRRQYRTLKMLYVTDPVQKEANKRRAAEDLGFMNAIIPLEDWDLVKHLEGYIHGPNHNSTVQKQVKVLIHEWVSCIIYQHISFNNPRSR
jgi:hypothetical protein